MQDNIMRIFSFLIVAIVMFMYPLYVAYEKKDNLSYAMTLKITYNFVNNVRSRGYLSLEMYEDFEQKLLATSNFFDIKMEHHRKRYDPVIKIYTDSNKTVLLKTVDYAENISKFNSSTQDISYEVNDEVMTEKQILGFLYQEELQNKKQMTYSEYIPNTPMIPNMYRISRGINSEGIDKKELIYAFNMDDEFTVRVVNKNVTLATSLFNTLTFGGMSSSNPRIYVNYGGRIINELYREDV